MISGLQKKYLFSLLLLAIMLSVHTLPAFAQRYHIQTFHEQDGIDSNTTYSSAQDSLGNIWFATRNGLTVFNGIDWNPISIDTPASPRGEGLISIDSNGVVWWVHLHLPLKVSRQVDGQWERLPPNPVPGNFSGVVDALTWVDSQGQTTMAVATDSGHLALWQNEKWITEPFGKTLLSVHSLAMNGSILLISTTDGLLTLDLNFPNKLNPISLDLPPGQVYGTTFDSTNNGLWVIGDQWLAQFKNGIRQEVIPVPEFFPGKTAPGVSICPGPNGGIYFSDFSHILHFHPQSGLEIITPANGVATEGGNHLMMDREKNIWICSYRGISKIMSRRLACYSSDHGLLGDEVSAVIQRSSGKIVLGHRTGLTFMDPEPRTLTFGEVPLIQNRVNDLTEDSLGQLWIAANHKGLGLLKADESIQWFDPEDGLSCPVFSVVTLPQHGVFAGTSKGLFQKIGDRFKFIELPGTQKSDFINIRRLVPISTGGFAIATRNCGLFFWLDGIVTPALSNNQEDKQNIYTVFEHPDGRFWVGTDKGLFLIVADKLVKTTSPDPEIHRPIYGILEDAMGQFWFGTDDGVTVWDGSKQTRFTKQEGLLGSETNRDALVLDNDGHIWIGTDSGVSVYRNEFDTPRTIPPILSLTKMMINGICYQTTDPISIEGPLASLVFIFHAPSFANDKHLTFTATTTTRSDIEPPLLITHWPGVLLLTNVPPGNFQVNIVGHTSDGLATNTITTPLIIISPPLLDRWYFRTLIGLAVALLMWLAFAYFSGRRYAHRLEDEVRHQTSGLRKSEEIARRETERLSSTLESISDGVVVIDDQSRVVLFNHAAEVIFTGPKTPEKGCLLEDILPIRALKNPDQSERYRQLLENPSTVRLVSEQVPVYAGENQTCWLEISAVPIAGSPGGLVFAFRDITNRRQKEQNEHRSQKLESLGLLAGGIAHDFNNLLTIMIGNIILVESALSHSTTGSGQLEKIHNASKRAQSLTRQLLTFAKGGGPAREISDLAPIIRDSASFNLSGSNIDCRIDLPDDLFWANVDADQISQVIGNLVINARHAMSRGGRLHITANNFNTWPGFPVENKIVVIEINDHGTGISEKDMARIFDPYFSTKEKGTGLGLAIAYSIAEKHGGQLTVDSTLGQGSTFKLILPACDKSDKAVKTPQQNNSVELVQKTEPLHILFMDDEEDIRILMLEFLAHLNHQGVGVANGDSAKDAYIAASKEGHPFNLVILDLTIPGGMGGLETLHELRQLNPQVKVIVASGYSDDPVMANFQKFGFSGFLKKPFLEKELRLAIGKLTKIQCQ